MTDRTETFDPQSMEAVIREEWNALTDEDMAGMQGSYRDLVNSLEKRYGIPREKAERQVEEWRRRFE